MKLPYDAWIDTREKRIHACMLLFLSVSILFLIPYVILGILLVTRNSYASLFGMLNYPILNSSYVSRIILDVISMTSYDFLKVLKLLWENIGPMELLQVLLFMAVYTIIIEKKQTTIVIVLQLIEIISCCILVVMALRSASLTQAIVYLRMIGLIFVVINGITLFICLIAIIKESKAYRESLAYEAIEIKEHMEEPQ